MTEVAPARAVPEIVTRVPPSVEPVVGVSEAALGAAMKLKASSATAVPPTVVTATSTTAGTCAGVRTVSDSRSAATVTCVPGSPSNVTVVPPGTKPVPVMVTSVPPVTGPYVGLTPVIAPGSLSSYGSMVGAGT